MEEHIFGPPPQLGVPFDGVLMVVDELATGSFRCIDAAGRGCFVVDGADLPLTQITIYDAEVQSLGDSCRLRITKDTWWIESGRCPHTFSKEVIELAAGFGGITLGTSFLGAKSRLCVDFNPLACTHLRGLGLGPVFELDLTHPCVPRRVHQHCQHSHPTALFGFPCQPFSSQGLALGLSDERCKAFWAGLRLIYLNQNQAAILECVKGAGTNPTIQQALHLLAEKMDMQFLSTSLDLADQWACRRARWWAMLIPKAWVSTGLRPWPKSDEFQIVGDIFRHFGIWSEDEERELHLTRTELEMYMNPQFGSDPRVLLFDQKANTILHSYGNALTGCPCKCRASSFSLQSLLERGLRGFFTSSRISGSPRFLHYREIALLLGVPNNTPFSLDCKSNLCLLGLIASPMQSLWIYAQLIENFAGSRVLVTHIQPELALQRFQQELLRQTSDLFWTDDTAPPGHLTLVAADGSTCSMVSPTASTTAQLLTAERFSLEWGDILSLTHNGQSVQANTRLGTGPYRLTTSTKKQRRDPPLEFIMTTIHHDSATWVDCVPAGTFIFEILRQHGISEVTHLVDEHGLIFGADHRSWSSLRLSAITASSFPTLKIPSILKGNIHGFGLPSPHDQYSGLNDVTIWSSLKSFVESKPSADLPFIFHPKLARDILRDFSLGKTQYEALWSLEVAEIFCIFAHNGHWALLHGNICGHLVSWTYVDGIPNKLITAATILAQGLSQKCNLEFVAIHAESIYTQVHPHTCGTIALAHAAEKLGLLGVFNHDQILATHHWLLAHQPIDDDSISAHGPGSPDSMHNLVELLTSKGVPGHRAKERASLIVSKLGLKEVQQAMNSRNSWAALKSLANRPQTSLRLITPEELSDHIDARSKSQFGAAIHKAKEKKGKFGVKKNQKEGPFQLEPDQLCLNSDHFKDEDGAAVAQISFEEVEVEATGVALCTSAQAEHFVASTLSSGALALVLVQEPPKEVMKACQLEPITFPAKYTGTDEHIIIFGAIKQLGEVKVTRHASKSSTQHTIVVNQVIKIQVFRDELEFDWLTFVQAPVRQLQGLVPTLQLCNGANCGALCGKTHAAVDECLDSIILEVWSRLFNFIEKGKAPPQDAEMFSVFLRVPKSVVHSLIGANHKGIYIEPKAASPDQQEQTYQIIWMPNKDRQAADHASRSCAQALGLVRVRNKYGIRVKSEDEALAFAQLRPDTVFISASVQRIYQLFPLPHGTQRSSIIAFLKEISWRAKPLQPGRAQAGAMSWNVGTADPPPSEVLHGFGKDILVTEIKTKNTRQQPQHVIASTRTQSHLRGLGTQLPPDPWQVDASKDPWHKASSSGAAPVQAAGKSHLTEVTEKLKSELKDSLRKEIETLSSAKDDAVMIDATAAASLQEQNEARMRKLEVTVGEVQAQNQQFQGWFHQLGNKQTQLEHSVSQVQETLVANKQEMQQIGLEVNSMNATIRGEVRQALIDNQGEFDKRFDRLEALMSKKQKGREWLYGARLRGGHSRAGATSLQWPLQFLIFFGFMLHLVAAQSTLALFFFVSTAPTGDRVLESGEKGGSLSLFCSGLQFSFDPFHGTRHGEASHPGPFEQLTIGTSNPTGLRNKESLVTSLSPGIWTMAETQLSKTSQWSTSRSFQYLARQQNRRLHCHFGAPVQLRSRSTWAGGWGGVACISDPPASIYNLDWQPEHWLSSRVLCTQHIIGSLPILVCSFYGFPRGPTYPESRALTDRLLEHITRQVAYGYDGLAVIQGDFNHSMQELHQPQLWQELGWASAQDIASSRWNHAWKPTCKGRTERDFIWVSPSLQRFMTSFDIFDTFMEHSTVQATFELPYNDVPTWAWPLPSKIPWSEVDTSRWHQEQRILAPEFSSDSTTFFQKFSDSWESSLNGFVHQPNGRLEKPQIGRGQRISPILKELAPPRCRASRPGEAQLQCDSLVQRYYVGSSNYVVYKAISTPSRRATCTYRRWLTALNFGQVYSMPEALIHPSQNGGLFRILRGRLDLFLSQLQTFFKPRIFITSSIRPFANLKPGITVGRTSKSKPNSRRAWMHYSNLCATRNESRYPLSPSATSMKYQRFQMMVCRSFSPSCLGIFHLHLGLVAAINWR